MSHLLFAPVNEKKTLSISFNSSLYGCSGTQVTNWIIKDYSEKLYSTFLSYSIYFELSLFFFSRLNLIFFTNYGMGSNLIAVATFLAWFESNVFRLASSIN